MTLQPVGRFRGTNAVVTGGAHGIGRACAMRLAAEGALVAVADLDQAAARVVRDHLPDGFGPHLALAMDVTNSSSVEQAIGRAADDWSTWPAAIPSTEGSKTSTMKYGHACWR